jgi:hypothetical protein
MAFEFKCDKCHEEIHKSAALVFSPPEKNYSKKWHICRRCYKLLEGWINDKLMA